jgi:hypothetical protein
MEPDSTNPQHWEGSVESATFWKRRTLRKRVIGPMSVDGPWSMVDIVGDNGRGVGEGGEVEGHVGEDEG